MEEYSQTTKVALQKVHPLKEVAVRVIKLQGSPTKAVVIEEKAEESTEGVPKEATEVTEEVAKE